jgi:trans-2,3-dihydro-3-hydroxyanthranilate isomerase
MSRYRYLHLDVFTSTPFQGNQLAVVFDAAEIPADTMQAIAREMAFSETVFVLPPENAGSAARIRIFTPGRELPMAGHPTIGSTFALAYERRLPPGAASTTLDLGIGPTRIDLDWRGEHLGFAWMTQPLPRFGPTVADRQLVAEVLGLQREDVVDRWPVESISCGVPFLFVPLVSRDAVDRAWLDPRGLARLLSEATLGDQGVFVFALEASDADTTVYSRMFAPSFGVAEDPATGSASGPLGCYLVRHGAVPAGAPSPIVSLQGVKMQRPSRIAIAIEGRADDITRVRVGGTSIIVAEGVLFL